MQSTTVNEDRWVKPLWLAVVIVASATLTTLFTCITAFAAFAVIAVGSLSCARAVLLTLAVWLANQAVGYGVLNYPWNIKSVAWGVAIGLAAVVGTLAAHRAMTGLRAFTSPVRILAAFVAAFALYQLVLYAAAVSVLGGTGTFTPRIVGQVLLVNAATLVGLYGLQHLITTIAGMAVRRRAAAVPARFA